MDNMINNRNTQNQIPFIQHELSSRSISELSSLISELSITNDAVSVGSSMSVDTAPSFMSIDSNKSSSSPSSIYSVTSSTSSPISSASPMYTSKTPICTASSMSVEFTATTIDAQYNLDSIPAPNLIETINDELKEKILFENEEIDIQMHDSNQ